MPPGAKVGKLALGGGGAATRVASTLCEVAQSRVGGAGDGEVSSRHRSGHAGDKLLETARFDCGPSSFPVYVLRVTKITF